MGLLLSILVTCVGVLEVIACVRHFQNGYLPLWTPHLVSSATTNLYEHWRTIPNYYCHGREVYPEHANILTNKIDTVEQNELFDNSFLEHCEKSDCEINVISYCTNADTSVQNTASVLQTESVKNDKFGDNDYKIHNFDSKDLRFVSSLNPELNIQEKHDSVESLYLAPEFNTDSVTSFDTSIFSEGDRILKNDTPSQFSKKDTFLKSLLHDCDFRENVKNQDAPEKTYDSFSQSLTENVPWVQDFSADNALLPLTTESKDIEFSSGVSQGVPEKIYEVVSNSLSQAKACVQDLNAKNIHLPLTSGSKEIELPLEIYLDVPEKSDEFLSRSLSQKESETCVKNYNADDVNLSLTTESNEFPSDTCLDVPGKTYEDVSHSFPQNGSETCAQNFNADNVHLILVTSNKEIEFPSVTSQNVPENSNECVRHSLLQNESEICVQNSDAADIHLSLSTESNKVEFPSVTCQDVPEKSNESVRYSLSQNESEICVKNSDAAGIHLSLSTESNEIEFPSVTCQDVHEKSNECVRHSLLQNESESFVQNSDDGNIHLSLSAESNEIEFPSVTCQDVPEKSNESVRYSLSQKESEICVQNSNPDNIHLSLSRGSNEIEFQLLTCQDFPEKSNEPVRCSLSQNERESFVQNSDDGNVHLPLTTESKEIEFLSETPEDVPEETVDAVNHSLSQTGSETCVQNFNADNIHLSLTTETKEIEFLSHVPEKPKKIDSCSLLQTEPCAADNNVDNTTDGKEIKIQSETHTYNVQKSEADNKDEKSDVHNQESALICNQLVSSASDDCNDQLVSSASDESLLSFQTNEFSKKEMALKRKRSYKSKKNNASMTDGRKSRILPASSTLEERNCVSREDANVGISSEIISSKSLSEITQNTANIWADVPFNSFETTDNEHSVDKSLNSFSVSQDKDDKDNKLCESTSGCVSLSQETEKHAAKCSEAEERSNCESSKEAFWVRLGPSP